MGSSVLHRPDITYPIRYTHKRIKEFSFAQNNEKKNSSPHTPGMFNNYCYKFRKRFNCKDSQETEIRLKG